MKRTISLILMLCIALLLFSCGKSEITAQEIYDAGLVEHMLESHQSVSVLYKMDGEVLIEAYLTDEYSYVYYPGEQFLGAQYMTDSASYAYSDGDCVRYLYITPDGVTNDFASDRAELFFGDFTLNIMTEVIESVTEKDGRMTVKSVLSEQALAELATEGIVFASSEYVLDAQTRELISIVSSYTYEDGAIFRMEMEITYDAEKPELLRTILGYESQTEDLRGVTVVSNPGTSAERSQSLQIPAGLIVGFTFGDEFEDRVSFYTDAACTMAYDPYADTASDLTVYVRWPE